MTSSGSVRQKLTWLGTIALGAWLSARTARWLAESVPALERDRTAGRTQEPVREIVEEALTEHQADDTPMVHAFEEALEEETGEENPV
jgi:hypothetical protein